MNLNLVIQKAGGLFGNLLGMLISSAILEEITRFTALFIGSFLFISLNTVIYILGNIIIQRKKKRRVNNVDQGIQ